MRQIFHLKVAFRPALIAGIALASLTGACAHHPKSSAHIYEGNAPTIRFSEQPEAPGGRVYAY